MAEQFLSQLLRMENRVQSNESQECYICMSECGTLSSETGIIECEIRLPCNPNHKFGSACIATWLKENNTCPICRHVFFPRKKYDDEIDEDEADERNQLARAARTTPVSDQAGEAVNEELVEYRRVQVARAARISELVLSYCTALDLNTSVTRCSETIGEQAGGLYSRARRSETSIAAASVYMASHLRRQPRALREISQLAGNTEGVIQAVYRRMYAYHHFIPDRIWREIFGTPPHLAPAEDRRSSTWPPLEHEFVDGENSEDEDFIQEIWSHFSTELHLQPAVTTLARRIAIKLETSSELAQYEQTSLVAICIYLASYISGHPESHVSIARVAAFSPLFLLSTYELVYADRERLLSTTMGNVALPPLPRMGSPPF